MASLSRRFLSKQCLSPKYLSISSRFASGQEQLYKKQSGSECRHFLKVSDLSFTEINDLLSASSVLKKSPISLYNKTLENKTLLMLFENRSLRTRVSFEVSMEQLGGHAIFYSIEHSPLGQKETFGDTGAVLSRYCDAVLARLKKREHINMLSQHSTIPVINALDDYGHPTQIISDLLTIREHKIENQQYASFNDLKLSYFGDIKNNVTYDIMRICSMMGFKECMVCGPTSKGHEYNIESGVIEECKQINNGCKMSITEDPHEAANNADIIYTDSWMSYGVLKEFQDKRMEIFEPYRVTADIMKKAKTDTIFMNCLPAMRGMEQTSEVIDGAQSVVFDQAENKLHTQKALLLYLINGNFHDNNGNFIE